MEDIKTLKPKLISIGVLFTKPFKIPWCWQFFIYTFPSIPLQRGKNKQNSRERSTLSRTMHTLILFFRKYRKYKLQQSCSRPSHTMLSYSLMCTRQWFWIMPKSSPRGISSSLPLIMFSISQSFFATSRPFEVRVYINLAYPTFDCFSV